MGGPHHYAPHPLTTTPTDTTQNRNSTSTQPAAQHKHTTLRSNRTTQDATNRRGRQRTGYRNNIRQQHDGPHANQADHEAAKTTAHQPHRSCSRNLTINRPHTSRRTLNQPGVHGSKREQRRMVGPRRDAPHPPITIPKDTTEHGNTAITQPTN